MNRTSMLSALLAMSTTMVGAVDAADSPVAGDAHVSGTAVIALADETADLLRRKVLVQCGLVDSRDGLPWYFHFEYGRALLDAGDARRAVVQLSQSVDLNPVPRLDKRLYGMWFTDYLPYTQLADAHVRLENWPCAAQAMQLAHTSGEAALDRLDQQRVERVKQAIERHADDVGACLMKDQLDRHVADARKRY